MQRPDFWVVVRAGKIARVLVSDGNGGVVERDGVFRQPAAFTIYEPVERSARPVDPDAAPPEGRQFPAGVFLSWSEEDLAKVGIFPGQSDPEPTDPKLRITGSEFVNLDGQWTERALTEPLDEAELAARQEAERSAASAAVQAEIDALERSSFRAMRGAALGSEADREHLHAIEDAIAGLRAKLVKA
jgi:hypothetical protein